MAELIRDTAFGHTVRFLSRGKLLPYPEDTDPDLWKKYVSEEKSGYAAYHGHTHAPPDEEQVEELANARGMRAAREDSETSSRTRVEGEEGYNAVSGVRVDAEKGKDVHVVDWYGRDDAQNPRNWSRPKKYFVTFEIVLLTFSVYIGSAIYTPGITDVVQVFDVAQVPATLGLTLVGAVCGPVLGPLVGGFAVMSKGWTWTIWELMWLSGFCWVVLFFFLPETSGPNILHRRAKRLRKLTGDEKLTCEPDMAAAEMTPRDIVLMTLVKPITLNFQEPIVFLLNLYIALIYGLLYVWFESFPLVFIEIYGFSLGLEGLAFLGILVGTLITAAVLFAWSFFYLEKQFDSNGNIEPEKRLIPAMVGCFFVPICLFWFGWSARSDIHWIVPIIGSSFFGVAAFTLFQAVLPYLSDAYPDSVASVLAGNDLMRSAFGAGFPLFASAMFKNLGINWASSTLAFLGIAFIPIPFALYKFGKQIRHKSKNARKDI
ncbi:GTPase-activating protein [Neocucurbitaria cava]|uniref:GTPase-activating protein n=1 Tax=Neocucurbitaria cava TaxID=798079 RepID=A0A9W8Y4C2_9PLEO|nr:GTPase-activating protein [Neocucurbitaria cava]